MKDQVLHIGFSNLWLVSNVGKWGDDNNTAIFELRYKLSKTYFISGFIFPNKLADFLENKFSDELISNYRDDLDFQHVVDLVQTVN